MKVIYLDDLQIHSSTDNTLGFAVDQTIDGLSMPDIRTSSYDKPGEYGAFVSNQLYSSRAITIQGVVYGSTLAAFNIKRRLLEKYAGILRDSFSAAVGHTLKFTTMDDLNLQTMVYIKSLHVDQAGLMYGRFSMELVAPDFYLENWSASTTVITTSAGGGFTLPVTLPITFATKTGGVSTIANNGNTIYYPTITLNGLLTSPTLYNYTIGKFIKLNLTIASTDNPVVIDMKNKTIKQGTTPILNKLASGSSWLWFEPGNNNLALYTSSGSDNGTISVSYKDAYLGV